MLISEVEATADPTPYSFAYEQEGIELVRLRIALIHRLRVRLRELGDIPKAKRTDAIWDELGLTFFRLYDARFELDRLLARLKEVRRERAALMSAPAVRLAAPTARLRAQPATVVAAQRS